MPDRSCLMLPMTPSPLQRPHVTRPNLPSTLRNAAQVLDVLAAGCTLGVPQAFPDLDPQAALVLSNQIRGVCQLLAAGLRALAARTPRPATPPAAVSDSRPQLWRGRRPPSQ